MPGSPASAPAPPPGATTFHEADTSHGDAADRDAAAEPADALRRLIASTMAAAGGWLPFDRFMALALYAPGLGYYARAAAPFGAFAGNGSDFVTAPELSPLFGRALAVQLGQALDAARSDEVLEFGAGSGALAEQLLQALGGRVRRYTVVEVSSTLRQAQRQRLAAWGDRVQWAERWPLPDGPGRHGVVLGNEVLDAMPAKLLHFDGRRWFERGVTAATGSPTAPVALAATASATATASTASPPAAPAPAEPPVGGQAGAWAWADRPTDLRPPVDAAFVPGTVTEVHPQAVAFVAAVARQLERGAAFFVDYGFPEAEYYHPQRSGGTLMCHRAHRADTDPLADVGAKDITAHLDFTALALAAQDAGAAVLGYTSQAHFLVNCGLPALLQGADARVLAPAQRLLAEHEMGELFKVLAFARGVAFDAVGFGHGDRSHRL